jgi:hypothetical protein
MHLYLLIHLVIFVQAGLSEISFRYEVKQDSLHSNGMRPRKREARLMDTNPYEYSGQYNRYHDQFKLKFQQQNYQSYHPEVPNYQVRKLRESPEPYGYTVNGLTVTPPSSGRIQNSPTHAPFSLQKHSDFDSSLEYAQFSKIPPPMPYPQFLNIHKQINKSPTQAPYHLGQHQRNPLSAYHPSQAPHHSPLYATSTKAPYAYQSTYAGPTAFPSTATPYHHPTYPPIQHYNTGTTQSPAYSPKLPSYIPNPTPTPSPSNSYQRYPSVPQYLPSINYQQPIPVYHSTQQNVNPLGRHLTDQNSRHSLYQVKEEQRLQPYKSPLRPASSYFTTHEKGHINLCFDTQLCVKMTPYLS